MARLNPPLGEAGTRIQGGAALPFFPAHVNRIGASAPDKGLSGAQRRRHVEGKEAEMQTCTHAEFDRDVMQMISENVERDIVWFVWRTD